MSSISLVESSGYDVRNHENAWINLSQYIELVDTILRTCPAIETLDMFAHEENDYQDRTKNATACKKVAGLQNLRSLSFGGASAGKALFQALSLLPHLESLLLVSDHSQTLPNAHSPEVMLSGNSFPALRNLTLRGLNPKIIERIYNSPQLFRRLYSAKIVLEAEYYQGCKSDNLHSAYAMKCFRHGCPHLTDLTILTRGIGGFFCLFRWFIPIFKQLPLRRLELSRVYLNPMLGYHSSEDEREELEAGLEEDNPGVTWEEFLGALPHIEELILSNSFTSHDLPLFARLLPKLCLFSPRKLGFKDSWEETSRIVTGSTATQSIVMCAREYPQLHAGALEEISHLAR
ncbi:hypothetical protein FRC12_009246 [Ceratobasidium sp. 428]|nr:hypothetical protein FRC12_009246 [Ceratobasidium sp. 428]